MSLKIAEAVEVEECLMVLLHAIQKADIKTYQERVSDQVSCFEPESHGHLLKGIGLHTFLVKRSKPVNDYHIKLIDPIVKVRGDMAFAAYSLHLTQVEEKGEIIYSENVTRIFEKQNNSWELTHFHRSK